jgi:hypothetical protein
LAQWVSGELAGQFKGRILSVEYVGVLRQLLDMAKKEDREVKVYHTSRISDRVKALKCGVSKIPVLIICGHLYQALDQVLQVIATKLNP